MLVLAVVFAEIADGGIDAKALAMLGVLSAVNAALRPLGAGTAGIETVFFMLVLAGRVFGAGFRLRARVHVPVRVGADHRRGRAVDAVPDVRLRLGRHARRPAAALRGPAEIALLAGYGAVAGYVFGFMLNLSFWPFSLDPASSIAYRPGCRFVEQWHRYLLFDADHLARLGHRPGDHRPSASCSPGRRSWPRSAGRAPGQLPAGRHVRAAGNPRKAES